MYRTLTLLLLILFCFPAQAEVYKRIDAEGNVEYTDVPKTSKEAPVPLPPSSTYKPTTPVPADNGTQASGTPAPAAGYDSVAITQPAEDETAREGSLTVTVSATPALQPGHRFIVLIDGNKMAEGQSTSLQVENIDRGTHSVQVNIVDASDRVITSSRPVTFHMQRTSTLLQPSPGVGSPYQLPEPYRRAP